MLEDAVRFVDHVSEPSNHLVRVEGSPPKLGMLPLGDASPLDHLLGFVAPVTWSAIGLRTRDARPRLNGRSNGGVLTMLMDRTGQWAAITRVGETVTVHDRAPEGNLADTCRRCLGLPTAPAPPTTIELWLGIWIDRVIEAALAHQVEGWEAVSRLHPGASDQPANPETLACDALCLAEEWTWSDLRRMPEIIGRERLSVLAELAEWMDDGMFARLVLAAGRTDLSRAHTAVEHLVGSHVAARIAETLRRAGVACQ